MEASLLKMVEAEGRGRSLVAAKPLKAGQVVLKDSPILLYSAFPVLPPQPFQAAQATSESNYCSYCFKFIQKLQSSPLPCPSCSASVFCSLHCQSLAFSSSHSPWLCQSLKRLRDVGSSPLLNRPVELQVQMRFLIAAYNLASVSPSNFQNLLSLQGEPSMFIDSPESKYNVLFLHSLVSALCPTETGVEISFSVELIAALLAKDKLNAFGLMEPFLPENERLVRAYGIYPRASFFNHDCLPNACRFDYVDAATADGNNTDIIVRLIHDIPERREICLSYFPVNLKYSERQRRLKEDYGFFCDCDRCRVEANWSDQEYDDGLDEDGLNDEEEEAAMDEDENEEMAADEGGDVAQEDNDFPHAYFFLNYMCNRENCWGTLAPLPPSGFTPSMVMECNVCGILRNSKELMDGNMVQQ
ncbi:hypothetical protein M9H77_29795 [Catharanthus roseus]|uniref:Uncharacterized protein n=1 Tax=Catharanthus roseus TaxID=4058 RepID=A0ACB9ZXM8_CATRO|nr:hypothetical protein M9H77_29795 [Catharanthus roseus]